MSKKQPINTGTIIDVVIACAIILIVLLTIWNTIRIQSITRQTDINKAHICGVTNMIFGPVAPEQHKELCKLLRNDLYNEWLKYK
jgi:hypothetical protein